MSSGAYKAFPESGAYKGISYEELTRGKHPLFSMVCLIECVPGRTVKRKEKDPQQRQVPTSPEILVCELRDYPTFS